MTQRDDGRDDSGFEERTRRAFDESVRALDAATLSRLNRARQLALEQARPGIGRRLDWRVAAGATAALVLALGVWIGGDVGDPAGPGDTVVAVAMAPVEAEDLEIVLEGENLDMLAELEFYDWVDSVEGFHGSTAADAHIG